MTSTTPESNVQRSLFDTPEQVRQTKQEYLARVEETNEDWMQRAIACFERHRLIFPSEFLAEVIREKLLPLVDFPVSHHAWGALTARLMKMGMIVPTGEFRATRSRKTHGHRTAVYRIGMRYPD